MVADGAVAGAAANIAVAVDFVLLVIVLNSIQAFVGVGLAPDAVVILIRKVIGIISATI